MKTFFSFILVMCMSLSLLAQKTETRSLTGFSKLSISTPAEVHLSKGSFKVVLEGDELDEVQTEVKGNELRIKRNSSNWSFFGSSDEKLVIHISMPQLEAISMSGSGKLESSDQFTSQNMHLSLSGSGKMRLNVSANKLVTSISGSGNIETSGTAKVFEASISGSGKLRADQLHVQEAEVHISGSGSCNVHVDSKIDAHISGSGSVNYTGNPTAVNARTSGSGRVIKRG